MRRLERIRVMSFIGVVAVTAFVGVLLPAPASASTSVTSIEVELADLINAERRQRGIGPLRVDVRLVDGARAWSASMRRDGRLSHDPNLSRSVPAGASRYAENVGRTQASQDVARRIHDMFMSSAAHRSSILDGRYTDLGVGIDAGGGWTYATQRFTAGAPGHVANAVRPTTELAEALFGGGSADHAVVARDDLFADALAAGPLAGDRGPLLITPPGPVLHPAVRLALERTLPRGRTVWLVGGSSAVSDGVARELAAAGWDVRRVAGSDRVATAAQVSQVVVQREGRPDRAVLATATDWPDASAGGAYGAFSGSPVLLTNHARIPSATARALDDVRPREVSALGGSGVIADSVVEAIHADRVSGATRQGTSAAIAELLWGYTNSEPDTWIAVPGYGADAWTWAVTAAPLAARHDAAVLLVNESLAAPVRGYLDGLGYGNGRSARLLTHGPVTASARDELNGLLGN